MERPGWVQTIDDGQEVVNVSLEQERLVLRRLRELCAWRAEVEEGIGKWRAEARAGFDSRLKAREDAITTKYDGDREGFESRYRGSIDELEKYYDGVLTATQRESDKVRGEINQQAAEGEARAKKSWQDEIWLIESDYEANEPLPGLEFKRLRKDVAERVGEIEVLEKQAATLLEQFKQSALLGGDLMDAEPVAEAPESGVEVKGEDETSDDGETKFIPTSGAIDAADVTRIPAGSSIDEVMVEQREALTAGIEEARGGVTRLSRLWVARLFRGPAMGFLAVILVVGLTALGLWWQQWNFGGMVIGVFLLSILLVGLGYWFLYRMARGHVEGVYHPLREGFEENRRVARSVVELGDRRRLREEAVNARKHEDELEAAKGKYVPRIKGIREERKRGSKEHNEIYPRRLAETKREWDEKRSKVEAEYRGGMAEVESWRDEEEEKCRSEHRQGVAASNADYDRRWDELDSGWRRGMDWVHGQLTGMRERDARYFPSWDGEGWKHWQPIDRFLPVVRLGSIFVDQSKIAGGIPADKRLRLEQPTEFMMPAWLTFPEPCSVLVETEGAGRDAGMRALQNMMLRLLVSIPPGKVRFTILDPIGLGQNFAGFMHLADHAEALVSERIWTEGRHIDQRLLDLTEHMESVIQKYLRNEYETIAEYNEKAGEIAEPYRFLVMADCPVNLSETAARRLSSIVNSGVRCGVYTLILYDTRQKSPPALQMDDLRSNAVYLRSGEDGFVWEDDDFREFPLTVDEPPVDEFATEVLHKIGAGAKDASRVQVPFERICPTPGNVWSRNSAEDLQVEMGRSGATKLQLMTLGHGTAQHVLIAGKTGSGKSTLLHVLITNLALWYGPDQVQVYLVDFKKGVEFKTYATHQIPHVRAVAIESDREFGVSVLERIDAEMKRRGDKYRGVGAQDVASYRRAVPDDPMPRILLVIDEFQEFFTEDDKLAQDASLLLDRLVRQGRAFGIHVILGSQTLGGAYGLARSTIGQMAVRIALQCSEQDAFLIMDEDNSAARLLARPGEAIYNDASGVVGANSPFQISWLPEDNREQSLRYVHELASESEGAKWPATIVFEGNVPADIVKNVELADLRSGVAEWSKQTAPMAWFGEPIAIKDPTGAAFRRQSGANVIIVGQNDEAALSMTASAVISLAAQEAARGRAAGNGTVEVEGASQIYVLDGTPPEAPNADYLTRLVGVLGDSDGEGEDGGGGGGGVSVGGWESVTETIEEIGVELAARRDANVTDRPRIFVCIHGLQRFRMLKKADDDFGFSSFSDDDDGGDGDGKVSAPDKILAEILRDGPVFGIHCIVWCDSAATVERMLDRNALREFETRVLFQMGSADSSALIDSGMASNLGLKRALLFCEELGQLEKFRPYALPELSWVGGGVVKVEDQ